MAIASGDGILRFFDVTHPSYRLLHTIDLSRHLKRSEATDGSAAKKGSASVAALGLGCTARPSGLVISSKKRWEQGSECGFRPAS
jgi:hypothetical protein